MKATKLILSTLVLCGLVSLASATVIQTNDIVYGTQSGFAADATDLVNSDQATFSSLDSTGGGDYGGSPTNLNNGTTGEYLAAIYEGGPWTVMFTLNTSVNTLGYTLTSITSIAGWMDPRADQSISVAYSLVGSDDFVDLGTYSCGAGLWDQDYTTKITLTDSTGAIVSGVDQLRVTISVQTNMKEIDVAGFATIPEPMTMSLLAVGGLLAFRRRR